MTETAGHADRSRRRAGGGRPSSEMADTYGAYLKEVVGDVVSIAAGRPDHVRKLNKQPEVLPLAI
ncbi:hypothetical protein KL864_34005 [Mycolicibacterium goodii]|uniref:hypothetical protein n=1 Tax=Mycolicibacterium goodii TaxID=134601 RepID=UPI001BDBE799|nr:hypothetical protein [Mycolicibacterium goodii]MBU8820882.1 hypothetical protein [Mycolicibacterium goodii]